MANRIEADFFTRPVELVARDLIGFRMSYAGCGGIIVETEAYHESEPACHAFKGITPRNAVLFGPPGRAYVYISYGIHHLLNFVVAPEGEAAAVLIRAIDPDHGVERMRERRPGRLDHELCSGPGKLSQAMGIGLSDNGHDLSSPPFELLPPQHAPDPASVIAGPRIGITFAMELPWRYVLAGNPHVSRPRPPAWATAPAG